ncbi:MAG TPA: HYR domain-containing protein [Thermoanaerobaculia bacterium]|nr:HYR domain-containing protein [Thermoanaerobaculia bacterium]
MSFRHVAWLVLSLIPVAAFGTIQIPTSVTAEATGPTGAIVVYSATVIAPEDDDGRTEFTITCTPPSLSLFPIGTTTVNCSATEGSTGSFPVIVQDTTPPALNLPFDIVVVTNATSEVVTYTASATDLVDGTVGITCTPPSGSTFAAGTTVVTCSASDSRGNTATDTFEVIISSTPVNPDDVTVEATGPGGANVTYDDSGGFDSEGRPLPGNCSPANGSLFPLGTTTVTCSNGSFTITVVDTTGPALNLPGTVTAVATTASGVAVSYTATASDLVDGNVAVTCVPASGSVFPVGTSTVSCSASDSRSNTSTGTFTVEVTTNLPNITAEATGPGGAVVTFDGSCTPASGSTFPIGTTTVSCSVGVFQVIVVDTTPPALSLPGNVTVEATSAAGAVVNYSATATDIVDGSVAVVCTPPSGSTFSLGEHTVSCSSTDAHNNTATGTFGIEVVDTTPPVLSLPDLTAEATSAAGAVVNFIATATDLVDGTVVATCTPPSGSTFPLGVTTVDCSATDAHNNTSTDSFTITVVDTAPPAIHSLTVSPDTLWAPNRKLETVTVTANVTDAVDPAPIVRIYDITCNETLSTGDATITGLLTASLRAERDGNGDGRVYTLHIEAIDAAGNRSTGTVTVTVPHDLGNSTTQPAPSAPKRRSVRGG